MLFLHHVDPHTLTVTISPQFVTVLCLVVLLSRHISGAGLSTKIVRTTTPPIRSVGGALRNPRDCAVVRITCFIGIRLLTTSHLGNQAPTRCRIVAWIEEIASQCSAHSALFGVARVVAGNLVDRARRPQPARKLKPSIIRWYPRLAALASPKRRLQDRR